MTSKKEKKADLSEEAEKCAIAFDVGMEEAFAVCGGKEGKDRLFCEMGGLLGLSADDAKDLAKFHKEVLEDFEDEEKRADMDFQDMRAFVLCKSWQLIDEEKKPFRQAISQSWTYVKDKFKDKK